MEISFLVLAFITLGLSITVAFEITTVVFVLYMYLYISKDFRKPLFVDYAGENMKQEERATVMSYNSQLEATGAIVLSPIIGLLADGFGLSSMFLVISLLIFIASYFLVKK
jgi:predicted MFS family arabinose efflux permease